MPDFDDSPICCPEEDRLGIDPLAHTISKCILNLQKPVGSVVAVHGRWGSGKSSLINLVRHHLSGTAKELTVLEFQCWRYRSEEALAVGFFRELHTGLKSVLPKSSKARKAFVEIYSRFALAGPLLGAVSSTVSGISILDRIVSSALQLIENMIKTDESDESLQREVFKALRASSRLFLMVIDDIDRLSPDEALVIFRLVKSVGRLPNVIYLLAYDRNITEQAVKERYPSEGAHYLEKIVQASFDLPEPNRHALTTILESEIAEVLGDVDSGSQVHLGNMFRAVVAPEVRTPRDVVRLSNALKTTYPAVRDEVDPTDFLALETLRLFRPNVYQALRSRKPVLVGLGRDWGHREQDSVAKKCEQALLGKEPKGDWPLLKDGLQRLFRPLQSIWSTTHPGNGAEWSRARRACSAMHFDTYFQFSLSSCAVPLREIHELLRRADQGAFVRKTFLDALGVQLAEGRTKASFLLEELTYHADDMEVSKIRPFLQSLYSIANDLRIDSDEIHDTWTNNSRRLLVLTRALLLGRTELDARSEILFKAIQSAPLDWLVYISDLVLTDQLPPQENKVPTCPEECLMSKYDAGRIRQIALHRIRDAARDGSIIEAKDLAFVLFRWHDMTGDDSDEVRKFCNVALENDQSIAKLARAFLGQSKVGQIGDHVHHIQDRACVAGIESLMDVDRFRERLSEVLCDSRLSPNDRNTVERFLTAWEVEPN